MLMLSALTHEDFVGGLVTHVSLATAPLFDGASVHVYNIVNTFLFLTVLIQSVTTHVIFTSRNSNPYLQLWLGRSQVMEYKEKFCIRSEGEEAKGQ